MPLLASRMLRWLAGRPARRCPLCRMVAAVALGGVLATAAEAKPGGLEREIKAALLTKWLPMYITWPTNAFGGPNDPIVVGILGNDPFGPELEKAVATNLVGGRRLQMRHLTQGPEARRCHILFVSASEEGRLGELLASLTGRPVLTVADFERFARRGGMLNYIKRDGKIRFEVNLEALRGAGLTVSPKILDYSTIVSGDMAEWPKGAQSGFPGPYHRVRLPALQSAELPQEGPG